MDVPQRPTSPTSRTAPVDLATSSQVPTRLFLHEPGWRVALKVGSERMFCYQMAPGQDYYHRLLDGEIYVFHGDERLCLACAERRGLLTFEPRRLGMPLVSLDEEPGTTTPLEPAAASEFILDLAADLEAASTDDGELP